MNEYNFNPEWKSKNYYFFPDDIKSYPDCWLYVVWSRRGPGKTYSALRFAYENQIPIMYVKRTNDDVDLICTNAFGVDLSPYVPINRDCGLTLQPKLIKKGLGGVYDSFDENGLPIGKPFSYITSLNATKSVKGIEASICDWLLLDEFIPQAGEVVKRAEGSMLLDLYMTIQRDRVKRGKGELKLILFANAENIATPITHELEIVDDMVQLMATGQTHLYNTERKILLHHITDEEIPITFEEENAGIYKAMKNTVWFNKAFGGEFSQNDFTSIRKSHMKNYQPMASFIYKNHHYYIWRNDEKVIVNTSKGNVDSVYDLSTDSGRYTFYYDIVIDLRDDVINGYATFSSYMVYDLILNYKKIMNIKGV